MSNKSKKATQARKVEQVAKAIVQAQPVVRVTPETVVHVAPIGTRTIVDIARDLNLTPKNARRILRSMKAQKSVPDYDHTKGNRHFLSPDQENAFKSRVMSRRV